MVVDWKMKLPRVVVSAMTTKMRASRPVSRSRDGRARFLAALDEVVAPTGRRIRKT